MSDQDIYAQLRQQLSGAATAEIVLQVLANAQILRGHEFVCPDRAAYDLVDDAFSALHRLTRDRADVATPLILDYLLPFLTGASADDDAVFARYRCRKILVDWLDEFEDEESRSTLRGRVLNALTEQIDQGSASPGSEEAVLENTCWAIARIGYRRSDVTLALWNLVRRHDNAAGDTALATLTSLGMPPSERERVLAEVHRRALRRRSHGLMQALRELADPMSIHVIHDGWLERLRPSVLPDTTDDGDVVDDALVLRILARIADAADELGVKLDSPTSDQHRNIPAEVWRTIVRRLERAPERLGFELTLGSDVAPVCNSAEVIPSLLSHFVGPSTNAMQDDYRRYLAYLRTGECIRPRQLTGWAEKKIHRSQQLIDQMRRDACVNTEHRGRFATEVSTRKEAAWKTALRLGLPDVVTWLEDGIAHEDNPYLRGELCKQLAALQIAPPPILLDWIREPLDIRSDQTGEYSAHEGAAALGASSASYDAFEALLDCGLTADGQWLQNIAQLLADSAVGVARAGEATRVVSALFERLATAPTDDDRTAAALALERLAALQLIPESATDVVGRLVPLIADETRSPYQRSLLLVVIGEVLYDHQLLPPDIEQEVVRWAHTAKEWLGQVAIETLALFNRLSHYTDLLEQKLRLQQSDGQWDFASTEQSSDIQHRYPPEPGWTAAIIGMLYRHEPSAFTPAVVSCLSQPTRRRIAPLLRTLLQTMEQDAVTQLPSRFVDAMLAGIRQAASNRFPQADLFSWAARLMPDRFAKEPWVNLAREWTTGVRIAIVEALGDTNCTDTDAQRAVIAQILVFLGDGQYSVRRAAYRALGRQHPGMLAQISAGWATSQQLAYRRRAAEASAWIPDKIIRKHSMAALYTTLNSDVEAPVRADTERAWRERRERDWSEQLLPRLIDAQSWSNEEILHRWPVGEALIQLGTDTTFAQIRSYLEREALPVHARAWLTRLLKEGEKHWREVADKWPQPWSRVDLQVDAIDGQLEAPGQASSPSHLITWGTHGDGAQGHEGVLWNDRTRQLQLGTKRVYEMIGADGRRIRLRVQRQTPVLGTYLIVIE